MAHLNDNESDFEKNLKDILSPGPKKEKQSTIGNQKHDKVQLNGIKENKDTKASSTISILVRIISILILIGLFILFAQQIAYR